MEKSKYLPPKFSYAFKDLAETYNVFEKENSAFGSDYESDFSVLTSPVYLPTVDLAKHAFWYS